MNLADLVDPEIAAALPAFPPFADLTVDGLRRLREQLVGTAATFSLSDEVERFDRRVPGSAGTPGVRLRIHRPVHRTAPLPCLYWMHGGGYVLGNCEMEDLRFDRWCRRFACVGVSVEYRLAPETPYPGPLDDCAAGLDWVAGHAADLGISDRRIGVGGLSSGGGLAAALALRTHDEGGVPLAFQLLVAPMLDDRLETPSSQWDAPLWPRSANQWGWTAYLGPLAGTGAVPAAAAPARADDLAGLPPAFLMVGSVDGFLDEDVDYALRLARAGVPTELHVYTGAPHGFDTLAPGSSLARRARQTLEAWLERALAGSPRPD